MPQYTSILVSDSANIRTIVMNRPEKRNALDAAMIAELTDAFERAATATCGAVILTGAGKAFCAGLDLDQLQRMNSRTIEEHHADSECTARLLRTVYDLPKPTIAAVNGPAIAGGSGLATICDFTIALPDATFGYSEVRIGFVPALVCSFLIRQVGEKIARDLLLTGRTFDAKEAHGLGLVSRLVQGHQSLMGEAQAMAQCLLRNSPESLRWTKSILSQHAQVTLDRELSHAAECNAQARQTADFREGIQSFLEKRKPEWPSLSHR